MPIWIRLRAFYYIKSYINIVLIRCDRSKKICKQFSTRLQLYRLSWRLQKNDYRARFGGNSSHKKICVAFLRAYHMFLRRKKLRISRNVAVGNLCKLSSYRENLIRKTKWVRPYFHAPTYIRAHGHIPRKYVLKKRLTLFVYRTVFSCDCRSTFYLLITQRIPALLTISNNFYSTARYIGFAWRAFTDLYFHITKGNR